MTNQSAFIGTAILTLVITRLRHFTNPKIQVYDTGTLYYLEYSYRLLGCLMVAYGVLGGLIDSHAVSWHLNESHGVSVCLMVSQCV